MKKNILLCLVGYLCLCVPTSTLTAQVADSPGADFLHRSGPIVPHELRDTHRGGGTRSDTMPERIDLVSYSGDKWQEGESSSAYYKEAERSAIVFYVQVRGSESLDRVRIVFCAEAVDLNAKAPFFIENSSAFHTGSLWDGAYGAQWSRLEIPSGTAGYLSLFLGERKILDNYLAFPGDSVKLLLDLEAGEKLFAGPNFARYEFQKRVHELLERHKADDPIGVHVRKGEKLFPSEEAESIYLESQRLFGPKVEFIPIDVPDMLNRLASRMDESQFKEDLYALALSYQTRIDADQMDFLIKESLANYYLSYLKRTQTLVRYAGESASELSQIRSFMAEMDLDTFLFSMENKGGLPPSEPVLEYYYQQQKLISQLQGDIMQKVLLRLDDEKIRDYLLAKHSYKGLKLGNQSFDLLLSSIQAIDNPEIKEPLMAYLERIRPGSKIADFDFLDESGDHVGLEDLRGKVLLVNTYFTGCSASIGYYRQVLSRMEEEFRDEDLILVSIAADRDSTEWRQGLESGKYNSSNWLRLRTDGNAYSHPFFRNYLISAAPRPLLIDQSGKLIEMTQLYQYPAQLKKKIQEALATNETNYE